MKRSEALKEISNLLKKCNGTYENHRNATAENILNKLEEIGMLPPPFKTSHEDWCPYWDTEENSDCDCGSVKTYEWESENEKK